MPKAGPPTALMWRGDVPLIEVQSALTTKGYYNGPVNGVWNKETWGAIVEFKRANGLQPNGVVTPATWDLLKQ